MRQIFIFAIALLCILVARADWAYVSAEELLKKTDLVVVARLTEVREFTRGDIDYSSGILVISETLRGDSISERRLNIDWSNPSRLSCPLNHRKHAGQSLIWLLVKTHAGGVSADHPGRVIPLEERAHVEALLKRSKSPTSTNGKRSPAQ